MGTRSLTRVIDEDGNHLICMYRQFDGYIEGMGKDLYQFLSPITVVDGFSGDEKEKIANGAGCLAAQLVAHFKTKVGGFYLNPISTFDCGQEFEYRIYVGADRKMRMEILNSDGLMFYGTLPEMKNYITLLTHEEM
jgi:hypothetical protein